MEGTDIGGGEKSRLGKGVGFRSAEVALRCSGSAGTSNSLSLFSLFMRLNVSGLGSPGTTRLLVLLFSTPPVVDACAPLECGLPFSVLLSSNFTDGTGGGGGGSPSSLFSHEPIFWKLRRSHTLRCSFTSERALCLLRLRLDSPLSADSRCGMFY
jgi:hypothetical protein